MNRNMLKFENIWARDQISIFLLYESPRILGSTMGPGQNIWAKMIGLKTTTSKINDLHLTSAVAFNENILRFQVTMY